MRWLAGGLLGLLTVVFIATRLAPKAWLWTAYLGAFAEAGMVGALADWFAVTALFRRPLGLPIPHTAIIPRNKDRIGEALGAFISGNFLTPAVVEQRLRRLEPARRLADWLAQPQTVANLARRIGEAAPELARSSGEWPGLVMDVVERLARARPLAPTAGRILERVWRDPAAQRLIARLVESLARYLAAQEDFIRDQVAQSTWRWMPRWIDRLLAGKFTHGLVGAAEGLGDPGHPWRADLAAAVEDMILRLKTDPDLLAQGEALKARWLVDPELPRRIGALWTALAERVGGAPPGAGPPADALVTGLAERGLAALARWLAGDAAARDGLDRWIRVIVLRTLSARRQAIGGFVAQVVSGWNAAEVADRLELQVGRDLQYIRINGSLVGGLVGLAIFSLSRWLS